MSFPWSRVSDFPIVSLFTSANIIPLCPVDVSDLAAWIQSIPFEAWPQQKRLADGQIRPAMVNDPNWHGFAARTGYLMWNLTNRMAGHVPAIGEDEQLIATQPMLSVVMPGHSIEPHRDRQPPGWVARVHVPLVSNRSALFFTDTGRRLGKEGHYLEPGTAYLVDVTAMHWIRNVGTTPRIHFMFDVLEGT